MRSRGPPQQQPRGQRPHHQQQHQQHQQRFDDYWTQEQVARGLSAGHLLVGQLRISRRNNELAFVDHPDGDADLMISGLIDRNRALNDDEVAVLIKPVGLWRVLGFRGPATANAEAEEPPTVSSVLSSGQAVFADLFPGTNFDESTVARLLKSNADPCRPLPMDRVQRVGQVVAIVRHLASRNFVGRVKPRPGQQNMDIFEPSDIRQPRCNVPRAELEVFQRQPTDLRRTLFVAELTSWAPSFFMPKARLCRKLGERQAARIDLELETRVLLEDLGIESEDPTADDWIDDAEVGSGLSSCRWDFRDPSRYCLFTVDKELAQDLDDAVHYRALEGGLCEVGVHISDVSHYVRPGTQIDSAARARAATTYLVQRSCNMLPQHLCEDICSLKPRRDRLAFSVVWTMDPDTGDVKSTKFGKSIIRSCSQLSYTQAQKFIEGHSELQSDSEAEVKLGFPEAPHTVQSLADSVRALHRLAATLLERRLANGALAIDQPRLIFRLGEVADAPPIGFELKESGDSKSMIEELMLLANCSVALKLRDSAPRLALLKQQLPPSRRALSKLLRSAATLGVQLDVTSAGGIQAGIQQARQQLDAEMQRYLLQLCVSPMQRAQNFCIGGAATLRKPELWRHYSLNAPVYTNFTSPIRRYADIVVHRQLCAAICTEAGREADLSARSTESVQSLVELARHCNKKEKEASEAGRRSTDLYFAAFFQAGKHPMREVGRVVGVLDNALDLFLTGCGLECRLFLDKQEDLRHFQVEPEQVVALHFKGCESDSHRLKLQPKSRLDVDFVSCQLRDGRPMRLMLSLKPPACELCSAASGSR